MNIKEIIIKVLSTILPKGYRTVILALINMLIALTVWIMTDSVDLANHLCNIGLDSACTWSTTGIFASVLALNSFLILVSRSLTDTPIGQKKAS